MDKFERIENWYNETIKHRISTGKVSIVKGRYSEIELERLIYSGSKKKIMVSIDDKLAESNYDEFMNLLDSEFKKQYPKEVQFDYSECLRKSEWLQHYQGHTVQYIIDSEVEYWEE